MAPKSETVVTVAVSSIRETADKASGLCSAVTISITTPLDAGAVPEARGRIPAADGNIVWCRKMTMRG